MIAIPEAIDVAAIEKNLDEVRERVHFAAQENGRADDEITIVAVSKTFLRGHVDAAYRLGLTVFGENRVQEAKLKFDEDLPSDVRVHLIGSLQSNKAKAAIGIFDRIESVDRVSLIDVLEKEAARAETLVPVLLQVNIGREPQKSGCDPEQALTMIDALWNAEHLRVDGLMGMAPMMSSAEDARPWFRDLRLLRDAICLAQPHVDLPVLSMGMSGDFEAAIAEGATHVRIGSAIFGPR